ncbi:hypothetical protein LCGC14_1714990 [marine sediment metagenome]|uniref:Uncharacterized protein n=1 Tax=marine sediment metagenome TaxID=412755 RepID=A0A0F9I1L4_9ZZZZ
MLSDEIERLRDALASASREGRLGAGAVEIAYSRLTDIARRVAELEKRSVPPAARLTETDLGGGKVLVLRP